MTPTIRISEDTRELLERPRREDETFDELLARIARETDTMNPGVWSEEDAEIARERIRASREGY